MGGTVEHSNGRPAPGAQDGGGRLALSSEFATVHVWVDLAGNGPRLTVEDQHNGNRIYLDPLELASLAWLRHEDLGPFLDPSRTGWGDATPEAAAPDQTTPGQTTPGLTTPQEAAEAGGQQ